MSTIVHLFSVAAAWSFEVPLPRMGSLS